MNDQLQPRPLYLGERTPGTKRIEGLMDFRAHVDALQKRSVYWPCRKSKHDSSVVHQLPGHYSDYAVPYYYYYYYYYYRYSALGPVWAQTRAQSGEWYGSGTLHPGQVLRGSLPLLSPTF